MKTREPRDELLPEDRARPKPRPELDVGSSELPEVLRRLPTVPPPLRRPADPNL